MSNLNFSPFPTIKTNRLLLRELKKTDSRYLFLMRNNPEVSKYIDRPLYKDLFETADSIEQLNHGIKHNQWIFWAIEDENKDFIGTICLWNFIEEFRVSDIGFELDPKYQGKGYMNEAIKAVISYAFDTLNLNAIWGFSVSENKSAIKLLIKNSFKEDQIIQETNSKGVLVNLSGFLLTNDLQY